VGIKRTDLRIGVLKISYTNIVALEMIGLEQKNDGARTLSRKSWPSSKKLVVTARTGVSSPKTLA
jgi:hypothetical protein